MSFQAFNGTFNENDKEVLIIISFELVILNN